MPSKFIIELIAKKSENKHLVEQVNQLVLRFTQSSRFDEKWNQQLWDELDVFPLPELLIDKLTIFWNLLSLLENSALKVVFLKRFQRFCEKNSNKEAEKLYLTLLDELNK